MNNENQNKLSLTISFYSTFSFFPLTQIFLRHANLGDKELSLTVYAGNDINTSLSNIRMKVNIMSEVKDIILEAVKEFKLTDVNTG